MRVVDLLDELVRFFYEMKKNLGNSLTNKRIRTFFVISSKTRHVFLIDVSTLSIFYKNIQEIFDYVIWTWILLHESRDGSSYLLSILFVHIRTKLIMRNLMFLMWKISYFLQCAWVFFFFFFFILNDCRTWVWELLHIQKVHCMYIERENTCEFHLVRSGIL